MKRNPVIRPTGIIRTLPYFGGVEKGEAEDMMKRNAYRRMMCAFRALKNFGSRHVLIALDKKPTKEVLHCYILVGGAVRLRANIAGYEPGESTGPVERWDGSVREPKWWAVLTTPVSYPERPIPMKGFQGFRYTEDLW